jgi:molybdate transport system ATP-binding protein
MLKVNATKVVDNFTLSLDVEFNATFTGLFGPSGAGKTTALNLISGLLEPTDGEIWLDGRLLYSKKKRVNVPPRDREIGYIFQENRLFPHMTVQQNLQFGMQNDSQARQLFRFDEIVEVTGVTRLLDRKPEKLSGGEKQRVAIARALLASPKYLLLDEPLAALDLPTRYSFLIFLQKLHRELGLPMVYVSHDLPSVLSFADEVVILNNGRNVGQGPPLSVLSESASTPLIGQAEIPNILEVVVSSQDSQKGITTVQTEQTTLAVSYFPCQKGERLLLNLPASEIIIANQEPKGLSARNILPGKIIEIHTLGHKKLVIVDAGVKLSVEVVTASIARLGLNPGVNVFLIIKASSFHRLTNLTN